MTRAIRLQGRGGYPFFLPPDAITGYVEADEPDFLLVQLSRAEATVLVRATVAELDSLIASVLVCSL